MSRTLNALQLGNLEIILGMQRAVKSVEVLAEDPDKPEKVELHVKSEGANWLCDSNDLDEWLDFTFRNQDCLQIPNLETLSAFEDIMAGFDVLRASTKRVETWEPWYGLQRYVSTFDEILTQHLDIDQDLKLRIRPAACTPAYSPRKKPKTKHS